MTRLPKPAFEARLRAIANSQASTLSILGEGPATLVTLGRTRPPL
jgi:hypothetical protein